jgi:hypothetical protein
VVDIMPYTNEHACRIEDPSLFKDDSFRRTTRKHKGKEYSVIMGEKKNSTSMSEQAYRYNKEKWSVEEARNHCKEHDGSFEKAIDESKKNNKEMSIMKKEYKEELNQIKKESKELLEKINKLSKQIYREDTKILNETILDSLNVLKKLKKKTATPEAKQALEKINELEPRKENLKTAGRILKNSVTIDITDEYEEACVASATKIYQITYDMLLSNQQKYANANKEEIAFKWAVVFLSGVITFNDEEKLQKTEQKFIENINYAKGAKSLKNLLKAILGVIVMLIGTALMVASPVAGGIVVISSTVYIVINEFAMLWNLIKDIFSGDPDINKMKNV